MASDTARNIFIGFMLFGLVVSLLVTGITTIGVNYNVSSQKMNEATAGALDMDDYEAELLASDERTSAFRERFESGSVDDVDDASGIFQITGDIIGVITTPFNLLAKVVQNILGWPIIVIKVILGILNILLILGIWSLLRKGD